MLKKIVTLISANTKYLISRLKISYLSQHTIPKNEKEIRLFAIIKNEQLRLPYFLKYYRKLGVTRFFIIDNDSNDGSKEYLLKQTDVHLFHTNETYLNQINWRLFLLNNYGIGHWCVTVDADDIFIYPDYEQKNLKELIHYLQVNNYNALKTLWVDIYSDKPIAQTHYQSGNDFFETCQYFDRDCINQSPNTRVFNWRTEFDKTPLIKYQKGMYIDKGFHRVTGNVKYAATTGVVFHFNFFSDFIEKANRESARAVYYNGGAKYKTYKKTLDKMPELTLYYEGSIAYKDSQQLVDIGLITTCNNYKKTIR